MTHIVPTFHCAISCEVQDHVSLHASLPWTLLSLGGRAQTPLSIPGGRRHGTSSHAGVVPLFTTAPFLLLPKRQACAAPIAFHTCKNHPSNCFCTIPWTNPSEKKLPPFPPKPSVLVRLDSRVNFVQNFAFEAVAAAPSSRTCDLLTLATSPSKLLGSLHGPPGGASLLLLPWRPHVDQGPATSRPDHTQLLLLQALVPLGGIVLCDPKSI